MMITFYVLISFFTLTICQQCAKEIVAPYAAPGSPAGADIPGYFAIDSVVPSGSLIIPMNNNLQRHSIDATADNDFSVFNLYAYGYVKELRKAGIPVEWSIKNFKAKDDFDIENVSCFAVNPPFLVGASPTQTRSFAYGPFVVLPPYHDAALAVLDIFDPNPTANKRGFNVAIYETTEDVTVNFRQHLSNRQHIAISDVGGNADIHVTFLEAAGFVEDVDFKIILEDELLDFQASTCFTVLTEPHFAVGNPEIYTEPVREFLNSGGNMLAECEGVETYESAFFLTTAGVIKDGTNDPHEYPNPDVPYCQMDGNLNSGQGGSVPDFRINPAGTVINEGFRVAQAITDPTLMQAMSGKINTESSIAGGVMFYLGGHSYDTAGALEDLNGVRMYLNAITSQTFRPARFCDTGPTEGEISVDLEDNPDTVLVGNEYVYTITLSNDPCGGNATDVVAVLELSPSVTFDINDLPTDCTYNSILHEVTCIYPTILFGGDIVEYFIPVTATTTGDFIAFVTVTTTTPEITIINNSDDEVTTAVDTSFTATILKDSDASVVNPGQRIEYSISLENTGPTEMTSIVIEDSPTNVFIESATASVGSFDVETLQWTIASLPPTATATLTVVGNVELDLAPGDLVSNEICIVNAGQAPASGTFPCDNTQSTVSPVQIRKTATPDSGTVGDTIEYLLEVINLDSISHSVTISDTLPSQLDYVANSLASFEFESFEDTFTTDGPGDTFYPSNLPTYDHNTETYITPTTASYESFNEGDWDGGKLRIRNGAMEFDANDNPFYGAYLRFSIPSTARDAKFIFTYELDDKDIIIELRSHANQDCTGAGELAWTTPLTATNGFVTEEIPFPSNVAGFAGPICFSLLNTDKQGGKLFLTTLELTYADEQLLGTPLSAIATNEQILPGETKTYIYRATLNSGALTEDVVQNFVELSSPQLASTINDVSGVTIEVDENIAISKSGSTAGATDGDTVTYTLEVTNESTITRSVDIEDNLPSTLVYTPNTISASHLSHTYETLIEEFDTTTSSTSYPSPSPPSFPSPFLKVNTADLQWDDTGSSVFVTGGVLTFAADTTGTGFSVPDIDLSASNLVEANIIYDYRRNGPTSTLDHYFRVGTGGLKPLTPSLLNSGAADATFETFIVSLAPALAFGSANTHLEFLISPSTVDFNDAATISFDNLRVELVFQDTLTPTVNMPPAIAAAFSLEPNDVLTITYDAVVTNPSGDVTNTLNVLDGPTGNLVSDQFTIETIEAVDDPIETFDLQQQTVDVIANDAGNTNPFSVTIINPPTLGTATVDAVTGSITYNPSSFGSDIVTYEVCLSSVQSVCSQADVVITNQGPPVAVDDNATVDEDQSVTINVLNNDSDPNNDVFTVTANTDPSFGSITFTAGCQCFEYTPNLDYNGADSFTYQTTDVTGLISNIATVNIVVNPVDDPIIANTDERTIDEDTDITFNVMANDINVDSDTITLDSVVQPANGAVTFLSDGTVTYTPDPDFNGVDTFDYTITSSTNSATTTVTINVTPVNDGITANPDGATTPEDVSITFNLIDNDTNVDGDQLTIQSTTNPANGGVVINGDGTVTYSPDLNFNGQDTFSYLVVSAGGDFSNALVTVDVTPVLDPLQAINDSDSTDEDTSVTIAVIDNDVNDDNLSLTVAITTPPTNGVASVNPDNTIEYTPTTNYNGVDTFEYSITGVGSSDTAIVDITINSVPDPIVAIDDGATTDEDTPIDIDITLNDTNIEGVVLTVDNISDPANGVVNNNNDGSVTYTPDLNFNGQDTFTYRITGGGDTSTATVTVDVLPVEDIILAVPDDDTTPEDTAVIVDILANDENADNRPLTVSISAAQEPSDGSVIINDDDTVTYTPNANFNGQDTFQYTITSGTDSSTTTVTITVDPVNDPIVAVADTATTLEDTPIGITVTEDDIDIDQDGLTVTFVSNPPNGDAFNNGNGTITYTPDPNFNGQDTFTYTIAGGGDTSSTTVTVTVDPVDDPIVAVPDADTTPEDVAITVDVIANDENVDNDGLTVVSVTTPPNGQTVNVGDGTITYTPDANFNGEDTFQYTITSGDGNTATTTVTITVTPVNDPIVAVPDEGTTPEDVAIVIPVTANDENVDNDGLTITATSTPTSGTVVVDNVAGTITYTPNPNFNGQDTFQYTITSGDGGTATTTVTITVTPVDDPIVAVTDDRTTPEDVAIVIPVTVNDENVDGDALTVTIASNPSSGTVVIQPNGDIRYTPNANYNGPDSFEYTITSASGNTDTTTVTITVTPVNDPIVANPDDRSTPEDVPVTIDVLDNDVDPDGGVLSVDSTTTPSNGVAVINPDNTITYTPNANFNGVDSFEYTILAVDGDTDTAIVTITIEPVNDPIDAIDDSSSTSIGVAVDIDVIANDINIDNVDFSVTSISQAPNGVVTNNNDGTVTYTPNAEFVGVDTFTYTITSEIGDIDVATVTVTVDPAFNAVDDNEITPEDTPVDIDVLANDSNPDGNGFVIINTTPPTNGAIIDNGDGTITYTPNPNFNGEDTFTYTIESGTGETDTATVTIIVTPVSDPIVANDDSATTPEDTQISIPVLDNDENIDNNGLTITDTTSPSNGSTFVNGDFIVYTPNTNFNGVDTFIYTITSGSGDTDTALVTITVTPVDDPITAINDASSTPEDTPIEIPVLDNDINPDGDQLTITSATVPANGQATITAQGTIIYSPNEHFNGIDVFSYSIISGGDSASAEVTVTVFGENDPITAIDDNETTNEDTPVTVDVLTNDVDPDGEQLTVSLASSPSNGNVVVNADNTVTYTPNLNFNGVDTFEYNIFSPSGDQDTATVTITVNPINDPIVAFNDDATTDEDVPVSIAVAVNDVNVDDDNILVTSTSTPENGAVSINADNTVTYTPNTNFNGEDSFEYTIVSDSGDVATATVTVTVNPVTDPIIALADNISTDEDTPVNIAVIVNDVNVDNALLTVSIVSPPSNGNVMVNPDGTITYTPNPDFNGEDTFEYQITTPEGETSIASVTVFIESVNDPIIAMDDNGTTPEDNPITVDILANDSDADGDTLSVVFVSNPSSGIAVNHGDGTVTYSPNANFNGIDSFEYTLTSPSGDTATATVTITVTPVADPIVAADDSVSTPEDTASTITVLSNDENVDNNVLGVTIASSPSNGVAQVNADGSITYTPNANFNGQDSFTYTITSPSGSTDTATVFITVDPVNDPITAVNDNQSTQTGSPVIIDVLSNDVNVDGDDLTVTIASSPANGQVTVNPDGTITYTPDPGFTGEDAFTYTITSPSGDVSTATVFLTVFDPASPIIALDDSETTDEDTSVTVDVTNNDINPNGFALTTTVTSAASNGVATVNGDGSITYTPNANFNGEDTFEYTITAANGETDTATVTITVAPVNDPIVATNDAVSINEDTQAVISVLANDINVDGDDLTVTIASSPSNGQVVVNGDGTITYTPNTNFNGQDTFTYTITSPSGDVSTATVTVTVDPVNDPIVATDDTETTDEDTPVTISVLANDVNVDEDTISISTTTPPSNGEITANPDGTITYTPNANFNGQDAFTYTITSASGDVDTATVIVTVNPVNDPIVAADDAATTNEDTSVSIDVALNDDNVDGDDLVTTISSDPSNGVASVNADGTITYTPNANFNGQDTFSYTITSPSGDVDTAIVTVTVDPVNDPIIALDDAASSQEDTPVTISVLANDVNVDGDDLTVSIASIPDNGQVIVNPDGTITYTPNANFNGQDTFTYTITSPSGDVDTATVTIDVLEVNDPIVLVDDNVTTLEDTLVVIPVLANDENIDGDALTITSTSVPSNGVASMNGDGTITYTPNPDFNGDDSFTYTVSSASGDVSTATVFVTVTPVDDVVDAIDDTATTLEDSPVSILVLDNDSNPDGTPAVTIASSPSNGVAQVNADGSITYTPNANFNGQDSFTYTITSPSGSTDTATVFITVDPVNDSIVASNDNQSTQAGSPVIIDVLGNDANVDGDDLTVTISSFPRNGQVTVNPDGTITYTPDPGFTGEDAFTYTITSPSGDVSTATVFLTVFDPASPITALDDSETTDEDTPVTVDVTNNDINPNGFALTTTVTSAASNGVATVNGDGSITYTPNANFNGEDTFEYTITAANGETDTATVTITVAPVNDPIVATNDAVSINEDTQAVISVLANDINVDGDDLTVTIASSPSNGQVVVNGDGTITYIPNTNFSGQDTFTYTITSETGDVSTATVTVTVVPVNNPVIAIDDLISTSEDVPTTISVLDNDVNVDGDGLSVSITSAPSNGQVTVNLDGSITYTPNTNFNGQDTFTYSITSDGGDTDTATVTIAVVPVNDPIFATSDSANTGTGIPVVVNLLNNDVNVDDDLLSVTIVTSPANGNVVVNGDGTVTYTPQANFNGVDTFTYMITSPSGDTATATVTVNVSGNNPPVANNDSVTVPTGETITILVIDNDFDPDGDSLIPSIVQQPTNGIITVNIDGSIDYTPNTGFDGIDTFTYQACDPTGACSTATVTISVIGNDPPVATDDNIFSELITSVVISVLDNDFDPEGETLTITFIEVPPVGIITLNPDQTITYSPDPNTVVTTVEFDYIISDPSGQTDTGHVTINYGNINPVAIDDTFIMEQGETLELLLLANDFDLDGDVLIISDFITPTFGSITLSDDATSFIYTADPNFVGTVTFTYEISDPNGGTSSATVTIIITTPGASVVIANDDSDNVVDGEPVTIDVLENDVSSPEELDISSVTITSLPENGFVSISTTDGSITYTPTPGFVGIDEFEYQVCSLDGITCDSATVTVVVFPIPPPSSISPAISPNPVPSISILVSPSPLPSASASRLNPLPPNPDVPSVTPTNTPNSIDIVTAIPDSVEIPEGTTQVTIDAIENDLGIIDPASLTIVRPPTFGVAIIQDGEIIYFPAPDFFGFDNIEYQICSFDKVCSSAFIVIEVVGNEDYFSDFSSSSSDESDDSWCVGGIVLWLIASVLGFAGLNVCNNGWHLLFLMQMIAVTGQIGISYPQFYSDFTSCFGWSILDMPLPWEIEGFTVLIDGLGGHGRLLLDFDSWVDVIDVNPEDLLWANLFWTMIVLILVLIVMFIVFVIVIVLQYVIIRSSQHEEEVEEQGGVAKSLVIEALEHAIRALLVFIQLVFFGLTLTAFVIIGHFFRNVSQTNLIAPLVVSVIIAVLGLLWIIGLTILYFLYRTTRWTNLHVIRILGFFYLHYRSAMGWWTSVSLVRCYLIAASVGFFLGWGAVQISLLLAIFIVYFIALILLQPYQQRIPYIMDLFVSAAIILILILLFVAWGLGNDSNAGEWILLVVIWLFWIAIVIFFIFLIIYFIYIVVTWFRIRRNFSDDAEKKRWDDRFVMFGPGGLRMDRRQQRTRDTELEAM